MRPPTIGPLSPTATSSMRLFAALNAAATAGVMGFLIWLVYFQGGVPGHPASTSKTLPAVNAMLNGLSAALAVAALIAVKRGRYRLHIGLIVAGLAASALFLGNYVYYHLHHGDTPFLGNGWTRPLYFTILITHVLLSIAAFPMILTSLFLAISGRLSMHRRFSRYTWAIWMYVSLSGVAVFAMLHLHFG